MLMCNIGSKICGAFRPFTMLVYFVVGVGKAVVRTVDRGFSINMMTRPTTATVKAMFDIAARRSLPKETMRIIPATEIPIRKFIKPRVRMNTWILEAKPMIC